MLLVQQNKNKNKNNPLPQETALKTFLGGSLVAKWVKDLALSLLWLGLLLWHRIDRWPGNVCMLCVWPKQNKTKQKNDLSIQTDDKHSKGRCAPLMSFDFIQHLCLLLHKYIKLR